MRSPRESSAKMRRRLVSAAAFESIDQIVECCCHGVTVMRFLQFRYKDIFM